MTHPTPDELLTMREVADLLRIHRHTLRRMVRAGTINVIGLSTRTRRVRRSEVERLLREGV